MLVYEYKYIISPIFTKSGVGYGNLIPEYRDHGIPRYRDTGIPGSRYPRIPGYRDHDIPEYRDTRIPGNPGYRPGIHGLAHDFESECGRFALCNCRRRSGGCCTGISFISRRKLTHMSYKHKHNIKLSIHECLCLNIHVASVGCKLRLRLMLMHNSSRAPLLQLNHPYLRQLQHLLHARDQGNLEAGLFG